MTNDWPALAAIMQTAHDHGLNVATTVRDLTIKRPLNQHPAQDLRYRLLIDVPSSLSKEQEEIVDELATAIDGNPREGLLSHRR